MGTISSLRVGSGFDAHRFAAGRPLLLGGVRIPFTKGLTGHSDADVLCHAVADAVLGAAGLGDIGMLFPDTDLKFKNASSLELLRTVVERAAKKGWAVEQVDCTVIGEKPRIAPYREQIAANLAKALRVRPADVNVKGKTSEGMGALGRGEGLAAMAVATLARSRTRRS